MTTVNWGGTRKLPEHLDILWKSCERCSRERMDLRVECFYDDESKQWGVVAPGLRIVGGAAETRKEAERQAHDAILFTLEDDDAPVSEGHEVGYFHVSLEPASQQMPSST